MIYTDFANVKRYLGMSETLDTAIHYLLDHSLAELSMGRNDVDGDAVYINRFDYTTIPEEQAFYEAHLDYADIHVLLSGEEIIKVADIHTLSEFERDLSSDYVGYHGTEESACVMNPEKILIVFPEDAHMVKLHHGGEHSVEKAVVKVKVL